MCGTPDCGEYARVGMPYCGHCLKRHSYLRNPNIRADGRIYAVSGGNLIKIGVTSESLRKRLSGLQYASPVPLRALGEVFMPGGTETRLHRHLAAYRAHGEWFRPSDDVLKVVGWIVDGERDALMAWLDTRGRLIVEARGAVDALT